MSLLSAVKVSGSVQQARKVLEKAGLDRALRFGHAGQYVEKLSPGARPSRLVGVVAFWVVFLGAISLAASALKIAASTTFVSAIYGHLPNVIATVIVFVVAGAVAGAVATLVNRTMGDTLTGKLVASVVPVLIMAIAASMILNQLRIAPAIVYAVLLGSVGLGMALAFGLGGRETVAQLLAGASEKRGPHTGEVERDMRVGGQGAQAGAQRTRVEAAEERHRPPLVLLTDPPRSNPPDDRPFVLDLSGVRDDRLAAGIRNGWSVRGHHPAGRAVIDLGERRTLPPDAIEELLVTHRASRRAGGRCALVVGAALAAQLALAHPEGILWAADCKAALSALQPQPAETAAAVTLRPSRRSLHVELSGEIDVALLPGVEALLSDLHLEARDRREIVFDLTRLSFVDLVALRALTTAAVRCQLAGARTRVIGARPQVRRLVRHLGWQEQLPGIDDPAPKSLGRRGLVTARGKGSEHHRG